MHQKLSFWRQKWLFLGKCPALPPHPTPSMPTARRPLLAEILNTPLDHMRRSYAWKRFRRFRVLDLTSTFDHDQKVAAIEKLARNIFLSCSKFDYLQRSYSQKIGLFASSTFDVTAGTWPWPVIHLDTKFEISVFIRSRYGRGSEIQKVGHVTLVTNL